MNEVPKREKGFKRNIVWSVVIDLFLWSYFFIVCYETIYKKMIMQVRYQEFDYYTVVYCLIIGLVTTGVLYMLPGFSIGRAARGLYKRADNRSFFKTPNGVFTLVLILMSFVTGLMVTKFSLIDFFSESGLMGAKRIFSALIRPNFDIIAPALIAAIETIYMAFIATAFAIPVSFIVSFFAARNLMNGSRFTMAIYSLSRFSMNMTRSIEPLVWAIIFSVWVGIGPFSGMLALCLHSVASLTKLYSEQIENIDNGPIEAITATGAHPIQIIWFGVVPQIVLPFLSFTIYRWDINVRMATIIGLVGGGGIGTLLMQYQGLAKWNEVGLLVMLIAIIVWAMDYISAKVRESIK